MELAWHNNLYRAYNLPSTVAEKEVRGLYSSRLAVANVNCSPLAKYFLTLP
jgi:hypothetical protein